MNRQAILEKFPSEQEHLLMILHALQNNSPEQYLTDDDLIAVADYLNITKSAVYGVATYYSMFSLKPRGKLIIRICRSPVCHMLGAIDLVKEIQQMLGIRIGETTDDGLFTLELSECLGRCEQAPSLMINEDYQGNLTTKSLKKLIKNLRAKHSD